MRSDRDDLFARLRAFIEKMQKSGGVQLKDCQTDFTILKLSYNLLLDRLDIFADVVNQRSEHETGVWVAGLDILAADSVSMLRNVIDVPPLICYLDRGHGAAIRRAHTRLPGGVHNPVAVIRIPRERMVGSGIGSSLVHEAGHQASALLDLLKSLKKELDEIALRDTQRALAWKMFSRWLSEILSDLWAVALLGISATTGLIGVVSLPSYFVFRDVGDDPHPFPFIRVKISTAFGYALYPDQQWEKFTRMWDAFYPKDFVKPDQISIISLLENTLKDFVAVVLNHKVEAMGNAPLHKCFPVATRQPEILRNVFRQWKKNRSLIFSAKPTLVFAVIGQARADNKISPFAENRTLSRMLKHWALVNLN